MEEFFSAVTVRTMLCGGAPPGSYARRCRTSGFYDLLLRLKPGDTIDRPRGAFEDRWWAELRSELASRRLVLVGEGDGYRVARTGPQDP